MWGCGDGWGVGGLGKGRRKGVCLTVGGGGQPFWINNAYGVV